MTPSHCDSSLSLTAVTPSQRHALGGCLSGQKLSGVYERGNVSLAGVCVFNFQKIIFSNDEWQSIFFYKLVSDGLFCTQSVFVSVHFWIQKRREMFSGRKTSTELWLQSLWLLTDRTFPAKNDFTERDDASVDCCRVSRCVLIREYFSVFGWLYILTTFCFAQLSREVTQSGSAPEMSHAKLN